MKTFSFYIFADQGSYSFQMKTEFSNGRELVIRENNDPLRHPDFQIDESGVFSSIQFSTPIEEFETDLKCFVDHLNKIGCPLEGRHISEALENVCEDHINRYGRLIYVDMLAYLDLFIHIHYAIFSAELEVYQDIYRFGVLRILRKFPNKVFVQTLFGLKPYKYK